MGAFSEPGRRPTRPSPALRSVVTDPDVCVTCRQLNNWRAFAKPDHTRLRVRTQRIAVHRNTRIMRSTGLCKAAAAQGRSGLHINDVGLRIIAVRTMK